jgi:hypothetical protein
MVGAHHLGGFAHRGFGAQGEDVALAQLRQAKAGLCSALAGDAQIDWGWAHCGLLWKSRHGAQAGPT